MHRPTLVILSLLLFAGCASQLQSLTITLDTSTWTSDEDGILHSKAILHLRGAVNEIVDLGDILGELSYVNPIAYEVYRTPEREPVAVLTSWFGGSGEELVLYQLQDPPQFRIEHRFGGEEGVCTEPTIFAAFPLESDVRISFTAFEPEVDQSSLAFCYEEG